MNGAHWHLILNHLPVLGTGFGILLLAFSWRRGNEHLKKLSLQFILIVACISIPAYLTGEPAEKVLKIWPGVAWSTLEKHEDAAATAFASLELLGAIALVGLALFRRQKPVPNWFLIGFMGLALVVAGLMGWTANLGGKIRHPEIYTQPLNFERSDEQTSSSPPN